MRKYAHIVSPVNVDESSDLFVAQPVTFRSMEVARGFDVEAISVELFSAEYVEDQVTVPYGFAPTPVLTASALDKGTFSRKRKLPFIKDILDRLYAASPDADYLIYTNVDIALMPHFYAAIDRHVSRGVDALMINRRSISTRHSNPEDLPLMYAQLGHPHPGHDCFVFKRELYPHFELDGVVVGARGIGQAIAFNLLAFSEKWLWLQNADYTFHLGDDGVWKDGNLVDYTVYNFTELHQLVGRILSRYPEIYSDPTKFSLMNLLRRGVAERLEHFRAVQRKERPSLTGRVLRRLGPQKFKVVNTQQLMKLYSAAQYDEINAL